MNISGLTIKVPEKGGADEASGGQFDADCKVLIVSGRDDSIKEIGGLLGSLGYQYCSTPTALEGLGLVMEDPAIGILVCDDHLFDMTGLDLARELARIYSGSRAFAFIMFSDRTDLDLELVLDALRLGIDDFLTRPIKPGEVARALRKGMDKWRIRARFLARQQELARQPEDGSFMFKGLLADRAMRTAGAAGAGGDHASHAPGNDDFEAAAKELLSLLLLVYRERERLMHKSIFGDPPWEISLELMKMSLAGKAIPVSSACTASSAPLTTSLRWVRNMEKLGLVQRWNDPGDKRRDLIELSDEYSTEISDFLQSIIKKWVSGDFA